MKNQKKIYRVTVKTTNALRDTFVVHGKYYDCKESIVYVETNNPADIFAFIPDAIKVEEIGISIDIITIVKESGNYGL